MVQPDLDNFFVIGSDLLFTEDTGFFILFFFYQMFYMMLQASQQWKNK